MTKNQTEIYVISMSICLTNLYIIKHTKNLFQERKGDWKRDRGLLLVHVVYSSWTRETGGKDRIHEKGVQRRREIGDVRQETWDARQETWDRRQVTGDRS